MPKSRSKSKKEKRPRVAPQPPGGYSNQDLKLAKFLSEKRAKLFPYLENPRDQKAAAQMVLLYIHKAKLQKEWLAVHGVLLALAKTPKEGRAFIKCVQDPYCSFSRGLRAFGSVYTQATKTHKEKMAKMREKTLRDQEEAERQAIELKAVMQRTGMADNTKWAGKGNAASTTRR